MSPKRLAAEAFRAHTGGMSAALLALLLVCARAEQAVAPRLEFSAAFAGMARSGAARDPLYGGALLGALEGHVKALAGMPEVSLARAYLDRAAAAADAAGIDRLRRDLANGNLAADRAAAVLAANALARPDQFARTLDLLEDARPGLGTAAAGILAQAEGAGDARLLAALRAAGGRQPRGVSSLYGRDGRWEAFFDNVSMARAASAGSGAVVSAADFTGRGVDGKPRRLGLAVAGADGIRVKTARGEFKTLSTREFEETFGVQYVRVMPRDVPDDLKKPQAYYHSAYDSGFGTRPLFLAEKDYGAELAAGRTAELYVGKVSEKVGYGLFAARRIKAGDLVAEYTGALRKDVSAKEMFFNAYLFSFPAQGGYFVDAQKHGNYARFANHATTGANANILYAWHNGYYHVLLVASKDIAEGEQVLYDYGADYWRLRDKPDKL